VEPNTKEKEMDLNIHHVTKFEVEYIKESRDCLGRVYFVANVKIKHLPYGCAAEQTVTMGMFADNVDAFAALAKAEKAEEVV
jgi:hypothetical protein